MFLYLLKLNVLVLNLCQFQDAGICPISVFLYFAKLTALAYSQYKCSCICPISVFFHFANFSVLVLCQSFANHSVFVLVQF